MPKKRFTPALDKVFKPWTTAKKENRGERGYIEIGWSLLQSEDFQVLTGEERTIYFAMICEAGIKPTFEFSLQHFKLYGISAKRAYEHIRRLRQLGFVDFADERILGQKTQYRFCDRWKGTAAAFVKAEKEARKKPPPLANI